MFLERSGTPLEQYQGDVMKLRRNFIVAQENIELAMCGGLLAQADITLDNPAGDDLPPYWPQGNVADPTNSGTVITGPYYTNLTISQLPPDPMDGADPEFLALAGFLDSTNPENSQNATSNTSNTNTDNTGGPYPYSPTGTYIEVQFDCELRKPYFDSTSNTWNGGPALLGNNPTISNAPVWFEYRAEPAAEYQPVPYEFSKWQNGQGYPVYPDAPSTVRVTATTHYLIVHCLQKPDYYLLGNLVGCVNQAVTLGVQPGCLLFDNYKTYPEFIGFWQAPNGSGAPGTGNGPTYTVVMGTRLLLVFREKTIKNFLNSQGDIGNYGWNHDLNPGSTFSTGQYGHAIWDKACFVNGCFKYTSQDFAGLFSMQ